MLKITKFFILFAFIGAYQAHGAAPIPAPVRNEIARDIFKLFSHYYNSIHAVEGFILKLNAHHQYREHTAEARLSAGYRIKFALNLAATFCGHNYNDISRKPYESAWDASTRRVPYAQIIEMLDTRLHNLQLRNTPEKLRFKLIACAAFLKSIEPQRLEGIYPAIKQLDASNGNLEGALDKLLNVGEEEIEGAPESLQEYYRTALHIFLTKAGQVHRLPPHLQPKTSLGDGADGNLDALLPGLWVMLEAELTELIARARKTD